MDESSIERMVADALGVKEPKAAPKFQLGDRVKIVALDDELTDKKLIGKVGTITDVEDNMVGGTRLQVNYDVTTDEGPTHYMHEEELEFAEGGA